MTTIAIDPTPANKSMVRYIASTRYGGAFQLHDTHGFSLTDQLFELKRHESTRCPDWAQFMADSKKAGWTHDQTVSVIKEAVEDSGWHDSVEAVVRLAWLQALAHTVESKEPTT